MQSVERRQSSADRTCYSVYTTFKIKTKYLLEGLCNIRVPTALRLMLYRTVLSFREKKRKHKWLSTTATVTDTLFELNISFTLSQWLWPFQLQFGSKWLMLFTLHTWGATDLFCQRMKIALWVFSLPVLQRYNSECSKKQWCGRHHAAVFQGSCLYGWWGALAFPPFTELKNSDGQQSP